MKKTFLLFIACSFLFSCVKKGEIGGGPPRDLADVSIMQGYTHAKANAREQSLLSLLLPKNEGGALHSLVLIKKDDRVAAVWWEERENAEELFGELTEKLFPLLSKSAKGIVDTVIQSESNVPVELLAFADISIHSERLFFARIGNALYEFHGNGEEEILGLLMELSKSL